MLLSNLLIEQDGASIVSLACAKTCIVLWQREKHDDCVAATQESYIPLVLRQHKIHCACVNPALCIMCDQHFPFSILNVKLCTLCYMFSVMGSVLRFCVLRSANSILYHPSIFY